MGKSLLTAEIVDAQGRPARRGLYTFHEILTRTRKAHPDWNRKAVEWQAEKLYARLPYIEAAVEEGLKEEVGRELRQRWEHGLGVELEDDGPLKEFSEAMLALEPQERGFVIGLLRERILGKGAC